MHGGGHCLRDYELLKPSLFNCDLVRFESSLETPRTFRPRYGYGSQSVPF